MFEDVLHWYSRRRTGTRMNQLFELLEEDSFAQVAAEIENIGDFEFSDSQRTKILQQVRDRYNKRVFSEATFEDWHDVSGEVNNFVREEETNDIICGGKKRARKNPKKQESPCDFDSLVKTYVLHELAEDDSMISVKKGHTHSSQTSPKAPSKTKASSSSAEDDDSSDDSTDSSQSDLSDSHELKYDAVASDQASDLEDFGNETMKPDTLAAINLLKEWAQGTDTAKSWLRDQYALHKAGFEVSGDTEEKNHPSIRRQHVLSLKTLLHLQILRQEWNTAYKTFSLLSKFSHADMRSIWPLGIEVLKRLRDKAHPTKISNTNMQDHQSRKVRQFFDWIVLSYPIYARSVVSHAPIHGPVFRSGSRTHSPLYAVESLWNYLAEKQYTSLRERLEELLLLPPFGQDGVFHYMLILCCLSENAELLPLIEHPDPPEEMFAQNMIGQLADDFFLLASKDSMRTRVSANIDQLTSLIDHCDSCQFQFPRHIVDNEIRRIKTRLFVQPDKVKVEKMDQNTPIKTEPSYFSLKQGELIKSELASTAVPEKFWNRFIFNDSKEGARSWEDWFFDYTGDNSEICLVCGVSITRSSEELSHLRMHGITHANQMNTRAPLRKMLMDYMVEAHRQDLVSSPPSASLKKKQHRMKRRRLLSPKVCIEHKFKSGANSDRPGKITDDHEQEETELQVQSKMPRIQKDYPKFKKNDVTSEDMPASVFKKEVDISLQTTSDMENDSRSTESEQCAEFETMKDVLARILRGEYSNNDGNESRKPAIISKTDGTEPELEPEPEYEPEAQPKGKFEAKPETLPEAEPEAGLEPEAKPAVESKAKLEVESVGLSPSTSLPEPRPIEKDSIEKPHGISIIKPKLKQSFSKIERIHPQRVLRTRRQPTPLVKNSIDRTKEPVLLVEDRDSIVESSLDADTTRDSRRRSERLQSIKKENIKIETSSIGKKLIKKENIKIETSSIDKKSIKKKNTMTQTSSNDKPIMENSSHNLKLDFSVKLEGKVGGENNFSDGRSPKRPSRILRSMSAKLNITPSILFEKDGFQKLHESLPKPATKYFSNEARDDGNSIDSRVNNIKNMMDGRHCAHSKGTKSDDFEGFSPDTTLNSGTSTHDYSRNISRDFIQFASQTQETQEIQGRHEFAEARNAPHTWRDEFSLDSNLADSSVNFTRIISDSLLFDGDENVGGAEKEILLVGESVLDNEIMSGDNYNTFRDANDSLENI